MSNTLCIKVHSYQLAVLCELNELNASRLGIMEMEVDISLPSFPMTPCYTKQNICSLIHQNRNTKALIYFHPKYTPDVTGKDELYAYSLIRSALAGGDSILSVGKGN
jgi:hypothetical protein